MNYSGIIKTDIANGEGVRVSLFVSGCSHHCKNCFNPETWNPDFGEHYNNNTKKEIFELLDRPYIYGLTLLGGDPLYCDNRKEITKLCKEIKEKIPNKDIWLYTGYNYEDIRDLEIINYIDVLIDGKFIQEQRDVTLKWRGSRNQRVIDIKKTLEQNKIILYCD